MYFVYLQDQVNTEFPHVRMYSASVHVLVSCT